MVHVNRVGLESLIRHSKDFSRLEHVQLKWVAVWLIDSGCFCWVIMFGTVFQLIFHQFTCHTISDIMDSGTSYTQGILWNKHPTFLCGWIQPNLFTYTQYWDIAPKCKCARCWVETEPNPFYHVPCSQEVRLSDRCYCHRVQAGSFLCQFPTTSVAGRPLIF